MEKLYVKTIDESCLGSNGIGVPEGVKAVASKVFLR